jgi:hypothetical protein
MSVDYLSYESAVIGYAIAMVAGSAAFRGLVAADDEAGARARIVEFDGGSGDEAGDGMAIAASGVLFAMDPPFAQVASMEFPTDDEQATGWIKRQGVVMAAITIPPTAGHSAPERMRHALNVLGAIRADIDAQFGQTGKLGRGRAELEMQPLPDAAGASRGTITGIISIHWRNT